MPEPHVAVLVGAGILHRARPWRARGAASRLAGLVLALAGASLAWWATTSAGDTDLTRPASLVHSGPYRFSRNPMYVGWTLLVAGLGPALGSWWTPALLPGIAPLLHRIVHSEERRLEQRFGAAYREYAGQVRRYL